MTMVEYKQPASFWDRNPDAVETLKKMWVKGAKVIDILMAIGGRGEITRNSIVGKAHRLKLDTHPNAYNRRFNGSPKGKPKKKRRLYIKPEVLFEGSMSEVKRLEADMNILPPDGSAIVHLFDTTNSNCKWVIGETKDMMCCGALVPEDSHYEFCPYHKKRATRETTR